LSRGKISPSAESCPLCCADDAGVRGGELTSFPHTGAAETCPHHTLLEALSPSIGRLQRDDGAVSCGLETYQCPPAVLCKGVAERRPFARECQARGRGSHVQHARLSLQLWESGRVSNQGAGIREKGLCAPRRSMTQCLNETERHVQADPSSVQLGVRLTRSTPLLMEKLVQIEPRVSFKHVIRSASQYMGQHR